MRKNQDNRTIGQKKYGRDEERPMTRDDSIKIPHSTSLHHSHTPILPHLLLALLILPSLLFAEAAHPLFTEAEALFQKKNYKDAGNKYEEFIKAAPKHEKVQVACTQVLTCRMRMREFAVGLKFAAKRIEADKGSIWEARSHQRYGNLLMGVPHWGTRRGGEFHRADRKQGEYVNSFRKDRKEAIQHLEAARTIYFQYLGDKKKLVTLPADDRKDLLSESLNANFDLSGALLRRREHAQSWDWWDDFAERDEEIEDYEPGYGYRRRRVVGSTPPAGLRADKDGNPIFTPNPKAYDAKLPDDQRVRYLLKEIQAKDTSPAKEQKALSIYRQAMVARARFGPDRVKQWWQQGHRRFGALGQPIENDPNKPEKELWELKENEALTWVSGELRVFQLPPDENVAALLDTVAHEYSKTEVADDALYATGAFFQTRQQYPRAIEAYQELLGKHPNTSYAGQVKYARKQIEANEIQIHQIGSQLTGEKAKLEISYRNAGRIRFTVQPIDLPAYLARITELNGKQVPPHPKQDINGLPKNLHQMTNPQNLSQFLLDQRYNRYLKLLSGEPTIWQADVPNDGSMRPAKTIVETPVEKGGCYFVQAEVAGNL